MTTQGDAQGTAEHAHRAASPAAAADPPVPRLPRGRGVRLSRPELLRIAGLAALLVFLIATQRPCANAVSKFVTSFGDQGSAAAVMPRPGTVDVPASGGSASPARSGRPAPSEAPAVGSGSATGEDPGLEGYERLRPGMTDDEVKAVIDRARARAAGRKPGDVPR